MKDKNNNSILLRHILTYQIQLQCAIILFGSSCELKGRDVSDRNKKLSKKRKI